MMVKAKLYFLFFLFLNIDQYTYTILTYILKQMPFFEKQANNNQKSPCDCTLFNPISPKLQSHEIFLKKQSSKCIFSNEYVTIPPKLYFKGKEKYSLKLLKNKKDKQNNRNTTSDQCGVLDRTVEKTELMTRADSLIVGTIQDPHHTKHNSCFSSYVFNHPVFDKSKNAFGRIMIENQNNERKLTCQKEIVLQQKTISEAIAEPCGWTTIRSKRQSLNILQNKLIPSTQVPRHARSESGEVMSIPTFYSQKYMKASLKSIEVKHISTIAFKKKTNTRYSYFQELHVRDTQSINGSSSQSFSQVISDQTENMSEKGQFSQIVVAKSKWKGRTLMPKFSKFK